LDWNTTTSDNFRLFNFFSFLQLGFPSLSGENSTALRDVCNFSFTFVLGTQMASGFLLMDSAHPENSDV
jgi:hypothetical protein